MHGDLVDAPKSVPEDLAERADEDDDDEGLVCRRPQSAQRALSFPNLLVTQYLSYLLLLQANICLSSSSLLLPAFVFCRDYASARSNGGPGYVFRVCRARTFGTQ